MTIEAAFLRWYATLRRSTDVDAIAKARGRYEALSGAVTLALPPVGDRLDVQSGGQSWRRLPVFLRALTAHPPTRIQGL